MESADLHHQHHQLQENLAHLGSSSSSSSSLATAPSYYGVGIKHAWTQPPTNTTNTDFSNPLNSSSFNGSSSSSSSSSINMVPDLGIHGWPPSNCSLNRAGSSSSVKEELSSSSSDSTFPKFSQMLTSPSTTSINLDDDDYQFSTPTSLSLIKNEQKEMLMNDLSEKLLLKTLSSSGINHSLARDHLHHQFFSSNNNHVQNYAQLIPGRTGGQYFSQIYPSINISNLNQQASPSSTVSSCSSLDMNLQAMDLSASSRFSTQEPSNSHEALSIYNKEIKPNFFGLQQMHQSRAYHHRSLLSCGTNSNKISPFEYETTEVKRPGSLIESKATQAAASKKLRLESRTPCPPLKVRKEKLGDRIATLQQLVAPFGKTDTASVLMETIEYIKFLQNQVKTLSVPYMKSSRNKSSKAMLQGSVVETNGSEGKRDLRSRGLCLVPLSCMSYVTAGTDVAATTTAGITGSVNWPNPNYGHGGT